MSAWRHSKHRPKPAPAAWLAALCLLLVAASAATASNPSPAYLFVGGGTTDATPMRECSPKALRGLQVVEIPAPAGGWSGTPQAVNVFNVFAGEVMVALGERQACGRMHDARTRDSRFRAGIGLVAVPPVGSTDPVRVGWTPPLKPNWMPTVRVGGPSTVQQEDTLRLLVRASCMAIALALGFSALMGFFGARDRSFIVHVVLCLALLLWQAVLSGLSGYPQPWLPVGGHESRWLVALSTFGYAAMLQVLWGLSGIARQWPVVQPGQRWLAFSFIAIGLLAAVLPHAALRLAWRIADYGFMVVGMVLTASALLSIRRGDHRAFALLASMLPLLALFLQRVSTNRIVIEYRIEVIQLVLTWFLVVMAYTLTNRYGQLREQRDAMRVLADTDVLTGVQNRRAGMARLDRCFARARADATPLAIGFIDVDRFKRINDVHGHDVGDRVLVVVADAIVHSMRGQADVVRMGGEEFLVLLPGVGAGHARQRLEAIREHIAEAGARMGVPGLDVTASIGLAALEPADEDPASLLRRADGAMYAAKHRGRNRIVAAGDLPPVAG
ncbi:diguanylate cyclase [Luteimonas marina]|uniref:diguanylate cyclase n=1 Tax=Luteimonas marina TaxID=488485 RepID=A0A5C5TWU4_9GAMM|nr:diguanylate cyclase [Luteimonas marina]TWT17802.1 diguanylate cyclase [Luteimonas marina]